MRTVTVKLDETDFVVPALNFAQLQEIGHLISEATSPSLMAESGLAVLKVALRRATPQPDYETLAPTLDEINIALPAILKLSGLQKPDANPTRLTVVETPPSS